MKISRLVHIANPKAPPTIATSAHSTSPKQSVCKEILTWRLIVPSSQFTFKFKSELTVVLRLDVTFKNLPSKYRTSTNSTRARPTIPATKEGKHVNVPQLGVSRLVDMLFDGSITNSVRQVCRTTQCHENPNEPNIIYDQTLYTNLSTATQNLSQKWQSTPYTIQYPLRNCKPRWIHTCQSKYAPITCWITASIQPQPKSKR